MEISEIKIIVKDKFGELKELKFITDDKYDIFLENTENNSICIDELSSAIKKARELFLL